MYGVNWTAVPPTRGPLNRFQGTAIPVGNDRLDQERRFVSGNRWRVVALLMGYAALGHFNRVGISWVVIASSHLFEPAVG